MISNLTGAAPPGSIAFIPRPTWTATCPSCGAIRAGAVELEPTPKARAHAERFVRDRRAGFVVARVVPGGPGWPVGLSDHVDGCEQAK